MYGVIGRILAAYFGYKAGASTARVANSVSPKIVPGLVRLVFLVFAALAVFLLVIFVRVVASQPLH